MTGNKKYSYIRKPYSTNGWYSFGLALGALLLFFLVLFFVLKGEGNAALNTGALGLSSMLAAGMGLWFFLLSLREQGKNRLFANIGGAFCGVILCLWIGVLIAGASV